MRANYVHYGSPQFRILSDKQIEELHLAALQILERTGVTFECQEAIELLGDAGADVSNPRRVRIPSYMVEQALRTTPKTITIYTRDGAPAIVLNGTTSHFGGILGVEEYLDPYTRQRRECYVEDLASVARVHDALPNIEWIITEGAYHTLPGAISDKMAFLQAILNSSKPVMSCVKDASSLSETWAVCAMIAGGEKELRDKPFFMCQSEPVTPLVHGKNAVEQSLFCAEKGVPNLIMSMPMAGATAPATFPAVLALLHAEFLSQLVAIQLKKPGAPVIYGSMPSIMDMKTTIYCYGAPEMSFLTAATVELGHHYKLPVYGTAGEVDCDTIGVQTGIEAAFQFLLSALSGAELIHGIGEMYHGKAVSPEFAVLANEIIDMVKVVMQGIEINDETLALDLIEKVGPGGNFLTQSHTFKHFRKFWAPKVFDRCMLKQEGMKNCEDMLNERTIEILKTHEPKQLDGELVKELEKVEKSWLERVGLDRSSLSHP